MSEGRFTPLGDGLYRVPMPRSALTNRYVTPEPIPTRCDCRFHDDGTTTTCGIHEPSALMYYTEEETE